MDFMTFIIIRETPGYKGCLTLPVTTMQRLKAPLLLPPEVHCRLRCLPEGSQLLRVSSVSVNKGGTGVETAWGIPRSPEEFVKAALAAGHPCKNEFALPQALQHAIDVNAKSEPREESCTFLSQVGG